MAENGMHFLLASRNRHKIRELEDILAADLPGVTVHSLDEVGFSGDIDENGTTFDANAGIKARAARAAALAAGHPDWYCLGDDSGLAVDALDGAPGVYSARFAGQHGDDAANNALLLRKLSGVPAAERGAHFLCCIACITPDGRELTVWGDCPGVILDAPRGQDGFGYDPLFYLPDAGMTFAELSGTRKNAVSHRGRALAALADALSDFSEHTDKTKGNLMSNLYTSYPTPAPLTSAARAYLRSLAADMSPVTQIGKGGLTENLTATVSDALEARELIKLSVLETADCTAREAAEALAEQLRATVVAVIGRKIILFRRPLNKKNRRIELPGGGAL